jgi:hypothetical protein
MTPVVARTPIIYSVGEATGPVFGYLFEQSVPQRTLCEIKDWPDLRRALSWTVLASDGQFLRCSDQGRDNGLAHLD